MPFAPSSNVPPLRELRRESGIAPQEVVARGRQITSEFPINVSALSVIELRGTRNHDVITALAEIYNKPIDVVSEKARRLSKSNQ